MGTADSSNYVKRYSDEYNFNIFLDEKNTNFFNRNSSWDAQIAHKISNLKKAKNKTIQLSLEIMEHSQEDEDTQISGHAPNNKKVNRSIQASRTGFSGKYY